MFLRNKRCLLSVPVLVIDRCEKRAVAVGALRVGTGILLTTVDTAVSFVVIALSK
jgi:hypothetical protein